MKKAYPIIITPDKNDYLVYVPDFEINTEGKSLEDAIEMARDAIALSGICLEDIGQPLPVPKSLTPEHAEEELVTFVDVDFSEYRRKNEQRTVKKNCTLPSWLNYEAEKANLNFSAILQNAIKKELHITD